MASEPLTAWFGRGLLSSLLMTGAVLTAVIAAGNAENFTDERGQVQHQSRFMPEFSHRGRDVRDSPAASCNLTSPFVIDGSDTVVHLLQEGETILLSVDNAQSVPWRSASAVLNPSTNRLNITFNYTDGRSESQGADVLCSGARTIEIHFDLGMVWIQQDPSLKTIHLAYMTHLDVGFTDGARNICDLYFNKYFPRAMTTATELRKEGGDARFVYTQFPWLVHEYLTGAAGCAHRPRTPEEVANLTAAIEAGDISWHALSLNILTELFDTQHFNWSLSIKDTLNAMLGQKNGMSGGKHTDVPGMSISAVPYLASHNILAIHIGINTMCLVPDIPPVFLWHHNETGEEVVVMQEHGYGDFVRVAAANDTALAFLYTLDNGTPPLPDEVNTFWKKLQSQFPNAKINVDNPLDEYAQVLHNVRAQLPLITQEIGDSWLYAAPADPYRIAAYRVATSSINEAVSSGIISTNNPALEDYRHRLMKPMEHNFGLDVFLPELGNTTNYDWSNQEFHAVRNHSQFVRQDYEWRAETEFCRPLANHTEMSGQDAEDWEKFLQLLNANFEKLDVVDLAETQFSAGGGVRSALPEAAPYTCFDRYEIGFNATDGSINHLVDKLLNRTWLNSSNVAAAFRYRTYTTDDFDSFNRQYNPGCGPPCAAFSKKGMEQANPESRVWVPQVVNFTSDLSTCTFTAQLALPNETYTKYGAPRSIILTTSLNMAGSGVGAFTHSTQKAGDAAASNLVQVTTKFLWSDKPATRLAEAMFLSFSPIVPQPDLWLMDIMNYWVSPLNVVTNGTRHLHAVTSGVMYQDPTVQVNITTEHTPLVSPGDIDHLLLFDGTTQPNLSGGWHFDLHSNMWGNNFNLWTDESGIAEFTLSMDVV